MWLRSRLSDAASFRRSGGALPRTSRVVPTMARVTESPLKEGWLEHAAE